MTQDERKEKVAARIPEIAKQMLEEGSDVTLLTHLAIAEIRIEELEDRMERIDEA